MSDHPTVREILAMQVADPEWYSGVPQSERLRAADAILDAVFDYLDHWAARDNPTDIPAWLRAVRAEAKGE